MKPDLHGIRVTGVRLDVSDGGSLGKWLHAKLVVPGLEPGETITLTTRRLVSHRDFRNRARVASIYRLIALQLIAHEVEEHLLIDGARVFDPHTDGQETTLILDKDPLQEGPL